MDFHMVVINTSNLLFHLLIDRKFPVSLTQSSEKGKFILGDVFGV